MGFRLVPKLVLLMLLLFKQTLICCNKDHTSRSFQGPSIFVIKTFLSSVTLPYAIMLSVFYSNPRRFSSSFNSKRQGTTSTVSCSFGPSCIGIARWMLEQVTGRRSA